MNGSPITMNLTILLGIADNNQSFFNAAFTSPTSFVTPIYNMLPKAGSSMFHRKHAECVMCRNDTELRRHMDDQGDGQQ